MRWIWQHSEFGNFRYDSKAIKPFIEDIEQSLEGLNSIKAKDKDIELNIFAKEAYYSFLIEGEKINKIALLNDLKEIKQSSNLKNLAEVVLDSFKNRGNLTLKSILNYNRAVLKEYKSLFYTPKVGEFRDYDDMVVASFKSGKENIEYLAIPAKDIKRHIEKLIDYINSSDDNRYIKASVAHLYFVAIHPFDDGNGRVARLISNRTIFKDSSSYFFISKAIYEDRKRYYLELSNATNLYKNREFDFTNWYIYFLKTLTRAVDLTLKDIEFESFKKRFLEYIDSLGLNSCEIKFLNRVLENSEFKGFINSKKYQSISKSNTALKDLEHLQKLNLIVRIRDDRYKLNYNFFKTKN